MKDILLFKDPILHWKIYLMPQSDRAPLGQGSASEHLFETRKYWPIPPTPTPTSAPTVKTEAPPQVAVIPHVMVMPKQVTEKCSWGLHCPICKNEEEHEEDRDGNRQKEQPRMIPQNAQCTEHSATPVTKHSMPSATKHAAAQVI